MSSKRMRQIVGLWAVATATVVPLATPAVAAPSGSSRPAPVATSGTAVADTAASLSGRGTTFLPSAELAAARLQLPRVDLEARIRRVLGEAGLEMPQRVALAGSTGCTADTVLTRWVAGQQARLTFGDQLMLRATFADVLPLLEAILVAAPDDPRLQVGTHRAELLPALAQLESFWDVDGRGMSLVEMRGTMLTDRDRVQAVYQKLLGLPPVAARLYAEATVAWAKRSAVIDHGRFPLLTFNAVAAPRDDQQAVPGRRIVMGEGLLRGYDAVGWGAVAPQLVLAHEYGHQVQFVTGMAGAAPVTTAADSERIELHADASAGYVARHPRGFGFDDARTGWALSVFHAIGDCSTAPGHHGSPGERRRAAEWGIRKAEADTGHVMPAVAFRSAFEADWPGLRDPEPAVAARRDRADVAAVRSEVPTARRAA